MQGRARTRARGWWVRDGGLVKASAWSLAVRMAGMVASFAIGVQLARFLGPEGFGTYGVVVAAALIVGVAAQAGLPPLATREIAVALERKDWSRLRMVLDHLPRRVLAAALLLTGALGFGAALWIASGKKLDPELWWAAPLIPLFALTALVGAELRGLHRTVSSQALETLIRPALMCVLLLGWLAWSGTFLPGQALALNAASSLAALAIGWWWLRRSLPREVMRAPRAPSDEGWFKQGVPLATVDLLKQVEANYGLLVLGLLAEGAEAGLMRVAMSTVIFVATPLSVLHTVLAPRFAQLHAAGERAELQRLLGLSAAVMTGITALAVAAVAMAGQPVLSFVFGEAYAGAWLPLLLLTSAFLINAAGGCGWVLLAMSGGERALGRSYAIAVPVAIALALALGQRWGASGVAAAAIVSALVQNGIVWRAVRRQLGLDSSVLAVLRRRAVVRAR